MRHFIKTFRTPLYFFNRKYSSKAEYASKLIDGKLVAKETRKRIKKQVKEFQEIAGRAPGLAVILVGNRPDSAAYVLSKTKTCAKLGMPSFQYNFPETVHEQELFMTLDYLNNSDLIDGILIQLPLPKRLDSERLIQYVKASKDVDGLSIQNIGELAHYGDAALKACTPSGVIQLLDSVGKKLDGQHAVILGRSDIVGKPMGSLLLARNCTVTTCHSRTKNVEEHLKNADIVVAALGIPEFVKGEWLKPGCTVIDVGINRVVDDRPDKDFKLVGDVHFDSAAKVAGRITPVPGGVGPMTIAMLLQNTVNSAWKRFERRQKYELEQALKSEKQK